METASIRGLSRIARVLLAFAASLGCGTGEAAPSFILITVDTLRADHLGCYGYFRDTSPFIDRLAADGILFENAITTMATTLPAHTSLMTSTYPARHGVLSNLNVFEQPVVTDGELRTAGQLLRDAGYTTAGFVSSPGLGVASGIGTGFEVFDAPTTVRDAMATTSRVIEWLNASPPRPFFLWVHYFDPHAPYEPPPDYRSYQPNDRQLAFVRGTGVVPKHLMLALHDNNLYDGEVRYTDEQIGWLLAALEELGLYRTSLVVLAGDHGEGLFEHGLREHGVIFNEQLFVPLIFKLPVGRGLVGARRSDVASLIDVLPTAVAALGLPIPTDSFDGVSLLSARRESALAEREHTRRRYGSEVNLALTTASWKYLLYTERPDELYDLEADFEELENVIDRHPGVASRMRSELLRIVQASREGGAGLRVKRDVSPELVEALRELGYVE
jgi:arylsulfatase